MKARSPVLGYNHNVRYAGRLWHVQTEDSGVANPHVFTHLFHDGTILATKRLDYDPASEVAAVQKLMQTQHKALLRELKAGVFDEKIGKFFGEPVVRQSDEATDPNSKPPIELLPGQEEEISLDELPAAPLPNARTERETPVPPVTRPSTAPPSPRLTEPAPPSRPQVTQPAQPPTASVARAPTMPAMSRPAPSPQAPRPSAPPPSSAHAPRMPAAGLGGRRPQTSHPPAYTSKPSAEGVVVARPAVIIGGESTTSRGVPRPAAPPRPVPQSSTRWHSPAPAPAPPPAPPKSDAAQASPQPPPGTSDNIFGGDLISEKSLDEVILAYLSEDLNEK